MLPSQHETIILAMDVSGSMRAADVEPNRLVAAQNAAKAFVNDQPQHTRIGVVSFAGTAAVVQPPTRTREDIIAAIDRFQLQRGTAVGSGILVSLKTIFPDAEFDLRSWNPRLDQSKSTPLDKAKSKDTKDPPKPVAPGSYQSAAIILLTDGQTTTGPDPIEAARIAAERGVRVFTVGIGTEKGEMIGAEGWSMRVRLDEASLEADRQHHARRVFLCGYRERPQEGLRIAQLQARVRAAADRDHRALRCRGGVVRGAGRHPLDALVRTHHVRRLGARGPLRRACSAFPRRA